MSPPTPNYEPPDFDHIRAKVREAFEHFPHEEHLYPGALLCSATRKAYRLDRSCLKGPPIRVLEEHIASLDTDFVAPSDWVAFARLIQRPEQGASADPFPRIHCLVSTFAIEQGRPVEILL